MAAIFKGDTYRITVLTDRLLRLEFQEDGIFEDLPTQAVVCRDFPDVPCEVRREDGRLIIDTGEVLLSYDEKPFSTEGLSCTVRSTGGEWHYSSILWADHLNLGGTARTLDGTDGAVEIEPGIFGRAGYAVIDDSFSPVFRDGNYHAREHDEEDIYFFGYGRDFYGGLQDFYRLCGEVPMIPRFALGNWWSRYYRYTEETYLALMDQFREEKIPFAVSVVDMDWHITDPDPRYGTGWTGYTWDPECFPDPPRFLKALHDRGLAVSLNLHPADGVRAFESMYPAVAKRTGIDPASGDRVVHDLENDDFRAAYFEEIMHPYEEMGVDFWWIDWQQGRGRGSKAVDPLLLLNHWHYNDQAARGKRALIFSRFGGAGSHRYPIGFSGDTVTSWNSLKLQPSFTSTASNIGYGFWSHDIGGHMMGVRDDERYVRWVQFGVFSPIMRLHSTSSAFLRREPWLYKEPYRQILGDYLRLRHQLVPYLYSAAWEAHVSGRPLVCPMYYSCPDAKEAYSVPNAYTFGPSLIVGAITEPIDRGLQMAGVSVYIPEGRWVDIFTGQIYRGAERRKLYRPLTSIPVLIREGGILPLAGPDDTVAAENPRALRILFGAGADGEYSLYEDDGKTLAFEQGKYASTKITQRWQQVAHPLYNAEIAQRWQQAHPLNNAEIVIEAASGDLTQIPAGRSIELVLCGAAESPEMEITTVIVGESGREELAPVPWHIEEETGFLVIEVGEIEAASGCTIQIRKAALAENDIEKAVLALLDAAYIPTNDKQDIADELEAASGDAKEFLKAVEEKDVPENVKDAIREVVKGC